MITLILLLVVLCMVAPAALIVHYAYEPPVETAAKRVPWWLT